MASVDGTAIIVAFPMMVSEFQASLAWIGWVFTSYNLLVGVAMPLTSGVVGLIGIRIAFIGAITLFLIGALGSAMSTTVEMLIGFRAVAALGGGAFMPLSSSLLADEFPKNRGRMLGLLATFYPVGGIVGPNLGGWLAANWGWRGIFYIDVPVCIFGLIVATLLLRRGTAHARQPLDLVGVMLLVGGLLPVMIGLTLAASQFDAMVVGLIVLGIVLLGVLVWWESRHPHPIIDLDLVRRQPFAASNVMAFGMALFIFSGFSLMPLFLERAYALTPGIVGPVLTPRSLANVTVALTTSFFLVRLGFRLPITIGFLLVGTGYLLLASRPGAMIVGGVEISATIVVSLVIMLSGFGMGWVLPAANTLGIESAPEKAAAIAGMRGAFNTIGMILGTTIGFLIVSRYDDQTLGLQTVLLFAGIGVLLMLGVVPFLPKRLSSAKPPAVPEPKPLLEPR